MKLHKSLSPKYEQQKIREGFSVIIGCDEVGRGCFAGPVVASAVILDFNLEIADFRDIKDSKVVQPERREELAEIIKKKSLGWGIGVVSEKVIDKINIHHASLLAMRKAVENLFERAACESELFIISHSSGRIRDISPQKARALQIAAAVSLSLSSSKEERAREKVQDRVRKKYFIAIDGKFPIPEFNMQQEAVVDGDAKILSVAAASIVAKVYRDNLMKNFHKKYPHYNFAQHKGYATLHHRQAIKKFGLSPLHRLSFCSRCV